MNTPLLLEMDEASATFTVDLFYKGRMANNISGKEALRLSSMVEVNSLWKFAWYRFSRTTLYWTWQERWGFSEWITIPSYWTCIWDYAYLEVMQNSSVGLMVCWSSSSLDQYGQSRRHCTCFRGTSDFSNLCNCPTISTVTSSDVSFACSLSLFGQLSLSVAWIARFSYHL